VEVSYKTIQSKWRLNPISNGPCFVEIIFSKIYCSREVDLFVANDSVVAITDPDMYGNTGVSIEVDLSTSSRVDVDAECTAEYGIPPPDIIWYIDEPTNTVDGSSDQTEQSDGTVVSSIRLSLDQNR
jgi:hypothetical protein